MTGDAFQIRRGVLRFHRPPESGDLLFLCWPVHVYRVTAPVLRVRHLNIIEKVVLALCQSGIRQPDELATKIRQSPRLCEHVLRQLRDAGRIDRLGVPTEEGRQTLATSRVGEEAELIVTHVFQDPWTGRLWPRSTQDLIFQRVHRVRDGQATLGLDQAGERRQVDAHIVAVDAVPPQIRKPSPQQIIDAVGAHRHSELTRRAERLTDRHVGRSPTARDVERDLEALSTELTLPHETAVHRVLDLGRPMSEYLLVWLYQGGEADHGPRIRDPFGLDPNPMLQRLLAERRQADPSLTDLVAAAHDIAIIRAAESYKVAGDAVKRTAESKLIHILGGELRRRPETLQMLLGVEEAAARGGEAGLEQVARDAHRLYEYLFRRLVAEYPPPDRPSWAAGTRAPSRTTVEAALAKAAEEIDLDKPPTGYLQQHSGKVRDYPELLQQRNQRPAERVHYVLALFPYILIAATDTNSQHRSGHPMRELARRRPTVLADLRELGGLRNRGSHSTRDATVEEDIGWCSELALDAARLLISMPPHPLERN